MSKVIAFGLGVLVFVIVLFSCENASRGTHDDIEVLEHFLSNCEPGAMMSPKALGGREIEVMVVPKQIKDDGDYRVEVMLNGLKGVLDFTRSEGRCVRKTIRIYSEETVLRDTIMTYE